MKLVRVTQPTVCSSNNNTITQPLTPPPRHGSAAVVTSDITFVVVSLANLGFALMNAVKVYQVLGAASVNTLTDNQRQLFHHALGLLRVSLRLACVITALLVVVVGVVFASFYWLKTPWYAVCCLLRVAQPTPASNPGLIECLVAMHCYQDSGPVLHHRPLCRLYHRRGWLLCWRSVCMLSGSPQVHSHAVAVC